MPLSAELSLAPGEPPAKRPPLARGRINVAQAHPPERIADRRDVLRNGDRAHSSARALGGGHGRTARRAAHPEAEQQPAPGEGEKEPRLQPHIEEFLGPEQLLGELALTNLDRALCRRLSTFSPSPTDALLPPDLVQDELHEGTSVLPLAEVVHKLLNLAGRIATDPAAERREPLNEGIASSWEPAQAEGDQGRGRGLNRALPWPPTVHITEEDE